MLAYVHVLVRINKCITKRLKYNGVRTPTKNSYLYRASQVFKLCIHCEYLVTAKCIENNFKDII